MARPFVVRSVLVPTDGSTAGDDALAYAHRLATRFGATLALFHAVEAGRVRESRSHERAASAALERSAERVSPRPRLIVGSGRSVPAAILSAVRRNKPDLLVMATHGRRGLSHFVLGSVTEEVITRTARPVLCLREAFRAAAFPYRRIVLPTDLSMASRLVFPLAAGLARDAGAEIVGVHVAKAHGVMVPSEANVLRFLRPDCDGLATTARVLHGTVADQVIAVARDTEADLIVMSTRGHDSLSDRILGSNTERVLRHAPCPVLVA